MNKQITSSADSTPQYIDYLPIYPSKKNQHSGVQLKLCNDWDGWTYMEKKSYVKVNEVYEIPLESLIPSTSLVLSDSSPVIFAYRWTRDDAYQSNQGYQQRSNASAPAIAAPRQPLLFTAPNVAPNTNSRNANASYSSSRPVNRPYQPLRQAGPLGQQAYQTTVTDENNLKKTAGATTLTTSVPTMGTQLIQT